MCELKGMITERLLVIEEVMLLVIEEVMRVHHPLCHTKRTPLVISPLFSPLR